MKIKIIRTLCSHIEQETQKFVDSLPAVSQIINMNLSGEMGDNSICAMTIQYLDYQTKTL